MSQCVTSELSPAPILDAFENYPGSYFDLDRESALDGPELRAFRDRLATGMRRSGLAAGDRVVFCVGNGPAFLAGLSAVLTVGGSPLLVHPKSPPPELKRTAVRLGAGLVIADDLSSPDWPNECDRIDSLASAGLFELYGARIAGATRNPNADGPTLAGVPLHPTSGTTGVPKTAVRPARAAEGEARHYIETIGVTGDDAILTVAPMCHAYAFGMSVMVSLFSGAHIASMRSFQPDLTLDALSSGRITIFPAVPAMLDVLLLEQTAADWDDLRCVLSAGSPLPERTANRFREKTGIAVRPLYGTTETGGIAVAPAGGKPLLAGQVGPAMRGVETRLAFDTNSQGAPAGVGRLLIRSSSMMAGYLAGDAIDDSLLTDGWFDTGDLAANDSEGYIQLMGRESDVINVEGSKVIPCEVEEVIAALPGVHDVKVYAGRRRNGAQFVKAAVVSNPQVDEAAILAHCERNLVYYKCPERIIPVDALPRSPAGKILRDQLP
jgi:acyl-CoA synthetase (AMP-forming)/AMP-acid ligase II